MSGGAPRAPRDDLKNQRATLGGGGHWIGNPERKAPREKRKRPGETGVPGLQNKNLKDGEPAEKGRDGHIAPSVRETPCVREGTSPEATPVPPCQPQKPRPFSREKRGGEPEAPCRETSCSKQKGKLPGEQPASQPSKENPARHRAGERQHSPGRRSRPNPGTGANGNRARRRRAKTHFSVG